MRRSHWLPLAAAIFVVSHPSPAALAQRSSPGAIEKSSASDQRKARRAALSSVKSWGYQLRRIDFNVIAASPFDLVVTDHAFAFNRRFQHEFSRDEIERMKTRPDGSRRIVLAYLSIGEAERYRFYWQQEWYEPGKAPSWLATANQIWEGNWRVRFWEPAWQGLISGGGDTYLARIKAQGFDGIYLDRADVYEEFLDERPEAKADMMQFIHALATEARRDNPGFLIVMQNAEELIADKSLRDALDGLAKEDLLFGVDHTATPNPPDLVRDSLVHLRRAKSAGLPVLVVEYLDDPLKAATAARTAAREGFVFLNAERSLGTLNNPLSNTSDIDTRANGK